MTEKSINFHNQKAMVFWFTGLSGAGKTTLSERVYAELAEKGYVIKLLDGDVMRNGLNKNLGFSENDRFENIRRIAEVSKLFIDTNIICINSFISPTEEIRNMAKTIIGENNYFEIFVKASLETCEKRDIKGLYKKARNGEIKNFTGIDAPFEEPVNPNLIIDTEKYDVESSVKIILKAILPLISPK